MLLGHWIEMRSITQAEGALKELAKLLPDVALRLIDGDRTEEVRVDALRVDDLVLIRPGASVPADGVVVSGKSSVNRSMITGESRLVDKAKTVRSSGGRSTGRARCAYASPAQVTTLHSPVSCVSFPRRRRRGPAPRR